MLGACRSKVLSSSLSGLGNCDAVTPVLKIEKV